MERWKTLLQDLPHGPGPLLNKLWELARSGAKSLPSVTLHLRTGRDVTGIVLDRKEERGDASWVLEASTHQRFSDDLVLVPASLIDAVTLHGASRLGQLIDERRPPPTPAELQRLARDASVELTAAAGASITIEVAEEKVDGETARGLGQLLRHVTTALRESAAEPSRRELLAPLIRVQLKTAPALEVTREGDVLVVAGPVAASGQVPSSFDIKSAIDEAL